VPLAGGEAAIREPWRAAAAHLERRDALCRGSAGRRAPGARGQRAAVLGHGTLFDAAAAVLGVREEVSYEGQAAIELEALAGDAAAEAYPCRRDGAALVGTDLVAAAYDDLHDGRPRAQIAAAVHEGARGRVRRGLRRRARRRDRRAQRRVPAEPAPRRLLERRLAQEGFRVLTHRRVPPNDGGLSYGQAAVAAARIA
jgi:hydrogenase maturation protein HypF